MMGGNGVCSILPWNASRAKFVFNAFGLGENVSLHMHLPIEHKERGI